MPDPVEVTEVAIPVLTRAAVAAQITARLQNTSSDAQLSKWAFNQFYQIELETLQFEEPYADLLGEILDELMFADDAEFRLTPADLQALVVRLGT